MKDLHVSWEEYRRLIETLAFNVYDSGWKFDSLLCLARGGLRPGDILSRIFDMPLNILSTSSYREAAGTIQGSWTSVSTLLPAVLTLSKEECYWSTTWSIPD